jgi:hypothetical protein
MRFGHMFARHTTGSPICIQFLDKIHQPILIQGSQGEIIVMLPLFWGCTPKTILATEPGAQLVGSERNSNDKV